MKIHRRFIDVLSGSKPASRAPGRSLLGMLAAVWCLAFVPATASAQSCPDLSMTCPTGESFSRGMKAGETRCVAAQPIENTLVRKCGVPRNVAKSNLDWWYAPARQRHACSGPVGKELSRHFGGDSAWLQEACVVHDMCYRSHLSKQSCDEGLVKNILALCRNVGLSDAVLAAPCLTVAAAILPFMATAEAFDAYKGNQGEYSRNQIGGQLDRDNDLVQYELRIDCKGPSDIKNTGTENAVSISFVSRGQGSARSHHIPDGKCNVDFGFAAIHNAAVGSKVDAVRISIAGDDAMWMDRLTLVSRSRGSKESKVADWGKDLGDGYCLSTDSKDAGRTWKDIVGNRGCQKCLEFRVERAEVVSCGR